MQEDVIKTNKNGIQKAEALGIRFVLELYGVVYICCVPIQKPRIEKGS